MFVDLVNQGLFFGALLLGAIVGSTDAAVLADVLTLCAPAQAAAVSPALTLEAAIRAARPEPVEGDEVVAYGVRLTVTAMDGRRVERVTLTLPAD